MGRGTRTRTRTFPGILSRALWGGWDSLAPCACGSGLAWLLVDDGDESWCPPGSAAGGCFKQPWFHHGLFTRAWLLLGWVGPCQHDRVLRQRPELSQLLRVWLLLAVPHFPIRQVGCWGRLLGLGCAQRDLTPAHSTELCHGLWGLCRGGQRRMQSIP